MRYLRDGLCATCVHHVDRIKRLGAAGIKTHLIAGDLRGGSPRLQENLQAIRTHLRGAVISIGAPNEPDVEGLSDWLPRTRAYQRELWTRVKGDPLLRHLPVLGPAVVHHNNRAAVGDLSAYLDRGNMHPYPGGGTPLHNLADERARAAPISGSKPLVATEAGYHSDLATTSGHNPTSERGIAHYTPRLALEGFVGGVERTYIYQLLDPWSPAEEARRGFSNMENSFGLLRWDLSRKPAFNALRNLMRAVDSGSAPLPVPGGLRFGLDGAPPDMRSLLLRSANGTFSLVLWRELSVWDRFARTEMYPASDRVDVVLGQPVALARRFDPVAADGELARWANPRRLSVDVGGGPVVLSLTPPGAPLARLGSGHSAKGATGPAAARARAKRRAAFKRSLKLGRARLGKYASVAVRCGGPCASVRARGRLVVRSGKRKRSYRTRPQTKAIRKGRAVLRLRLSRRARRVAARARKRGGRVRLVLTISGRTASGVRLGTSTRTLKVRRRR